MSAKSNVSVRAMNKWLKSLHFQRTCCKDFPLAKRGIQNRGSIYHSKFICFLVQHRTLQDKLISSYIFILLEGLQQLTSINTWPTNCFSHSEETEAISSEPRLLDDNICKIKTSVQKPNPQLMSQLHMKSSAHYMRISNLGDICISSIKYVFSNYCASQPSILSS